MVVGVALVLLELNQWVRSMRDSTANSPGKVWGLGRGSPRWNGRRGGKGVSVSMGSCSRLVMDTRKVSNGCAGACG